MEEHFSKAARLLVVGASFVVVIAGMRLAAPILVPFLLALFLALLCLPVVRWMHEKRVPDSLAVPAVLVLALIVSALVLSVLAASMTDFAAHVPTYAERVRAMQADAVAWLEEHDVRVPLGTEEGLDASRILGYVRVALGQVSGLLGNLVLIALLVVFLLAELLVLPRKLAAMAPDGEGHGAFDRIVRAVNRYISIKTTVSFFTGAAAGLLCWALGVPFAVLWAMLAFLLNYIPNIGSFLAAVPPVLVALIEPDLGWGQAAGVAAGYTGINLFFGNVVEPSMMGRSLDLSTLVVFVSMVFWGWVFGAMGMFLSVPLTMVIKIALEASPSTRPIAILLGSAPEPESAPR